MKLKLNVKTRRPFLAIALILIAPATYASDCHQTAIDAAEALYKINIPTSSNIATTSQLVSGPVATESGNVYVWKIQMLENGVQKNSAYQFKIMDGDQCTVFEFSIPSAS